MTSPLQTLGEPLMHSDGGDSSSVVVAWFTTVQAFLADTTLSVSEGDVIMAAGFQYRVAAAEANDEHVETAGGVKAYVEPALGIWDVRAFGAVADDATDARLPVNKAIAVVNALGGGVVYVPGKYRFSRDPATHIGIRIRDDIELVGAGRGGTALSWLASETSSTSMLISGNGLRNNVRVAHMTLDGVKTERFGSSPPWQIVGEGIEIDGSNLRFEDLAVRNFTGEGLDTDTCDGVTYRDILVEDNEGNGLHCSDNNARNMMADGIVSRRNAHGRRSSGNTRYGGLALRGQGFRLSNIISRGDARPLHCEAVSGGKIAIIGMDAVTDQDVHSGASAHRGSLFRIVGSGVVEMVSCEFTQSVDHGRTDCFAEGALVKVIGLTVRSSTSGSALFFGSEVQFNDFLIAAPSASHGINLRDFSGYSLLANGQIINSGNQVRCRDNHVIKGHNVTCTGGGSVVLEQGRSIVMACDLEAISHTGADIVRNNVIDGTFVAEGDGT